MKKLAIALVALAVSTLTPALAEVKLSAVKPQEACVGDRVNISGSGFNPNAYSNTVMFGAINAQVLFVTPTGIDVRVPNVPMGANNITVVVGRDKSNAVPIKIFAYPEISGLSLSSVTPGMEFTISGKNFSPKASDNKVTVDGTTVQVTSASQNSLTVLVPETISYRLGVPVQVQVGTVKSRERMNIDVQLRTY
jgi:hypothetical protein